MLTREPLTSDSDHALRLYRVAALVDEDVGEIAWGKVGRCQPGERQREAA